MRYFLTTLLCGVLLCSCGGPTLSETEMMIITEKIPLKLYESNVENAIDPQDLYNDLWASVHAVAEYYENDTEKVYNDPLFSDLFSSIDNTISAFGGTSMAQRYYDYVDFCNDHQDHLVDAVKQVTEVLKKNPDLYPYGDGEGIHLNLKAFSHIFMMPGAADDDAVNTYADILIGPDNYVRMGRYLMGTPERPHYNPAVVVGQALVRMGNQELPKPVYAVYDEEDGTWDVGYSCKRAVNILFEPKKNYTNYSFDETKYLPSLINVPDNVLNKSKKK